MKQLKVLVTGGAGFIGSHLCRSLLAEGHDVLCVDSLFTGSKDNILDLFENKKFEFLPSRRTCIDLRNRTTRDAP